MSYQIQEFARLGSVTVRTLHHYDRLGLLQPRRTAAGYRVYRPGDLARLEQIAALKFLGLPLKQIGRILGREPLALADALRAQRGALEEKRRMLDRAIAAIRDAESAIQPGKRPDSALLQRIIEEIAMHDNADWMLRYTNEAARAKLKQREPWTPELQARISQQWTELFAEVRAALGEDPASAKVQALADRWIALVEEFTNSDPDLTRSASKAWADQANWPAEIREQSRPFMDKEVWMYMERAVAIRRARQQG